METGYFDRLGPFRICDEMCIASNNLEYVYKFVSLLENYFDFVTLESIASEIQFVWEYTLAELNHQMDGGTSGEEMPAMFHERLHSALELM
ncbi:hypothetical protein NQ318_003222, partial [Aromia moschata]